MPKYYAVYILSNYGRNVLYTGVTNNLIRRIYEHRTKAIPGFTARYNVNRLVFYELTENIRSAIEQEKRIKGWSRAQKVELIRKFNPSWRDLFDEVY